MTDHAGKPSVLITGACGYLGTLLCDRLDRDYPEKSRHIVAYDIHARPEVRQWKHIQFIQADIRDQEKLRGIIKKYEIDTLVHLVAIVDSHDLNQRDYEYEIEVTGTEGLLQVCAEEGVKKLILTSSGAAYGYHADNPPLITEEYPLRGNYAFPYAWHKTIIEQRLAEYRAKYPHMQQLVLRPGTILGATTDNQITNLFKQPFIIGVMGTDTPFVFIWDEDVVAVILKGIYEGLTGIYNLAGDGVVTLREIARTLDKPFVPLPAGLLKCILFIGKKLRLTRYGPHQVDFLRYRPVLSNQKLKETAKYLPQLDSKAVFDLYIRSQKLTSN